MAATLKIFDTCSGHYIGDFEQVKVCWDLTVLSDTNFNRI